MDPEELLRDVLLGVGNGHVDHQARGESGTYRWERCWVEWLRAWVLNSHRWSGHRHWVPANDHWRQKEAGPQRLTGRVVGIVL